MTEVLTISNVSGEITFREHVFEESPLRGLRQSESLAFRTRAE